MLALLSVVPSGYAQDVLPGSQYINQYARAGRPTITIFLWGEVGTPGVWRVEPDVDLIELLSVVGVTGIGVDEVGTRRRTILRIYREEGGQRSEIYNVPLERIVSEGRAYPALQDGDVLEVVTRSRGRVSFSLVTQVIGAAAALTLLIIQLSDIRGR